MTLTNGTDIQALRSQEERGDPTKSCQRTPGIWDAGEHEVNEEQSKDRKTAASNRDEQAAGCAGLRRAAPQAGGTRWLKTTVTMRMVYEEASGPRVPQHRGHHPALRDNPRFPLESGLLCRIEMLTRTWDCHGEENRRNTRSHAFPRAAGAPAHRAPLAASHTE